MSEAPSRKFRFIGCEIVYREACYLAATGRHRVDVEFLRKGLHDLPTEEMRAKLQATIDATDAADGYEAVLLGYARCSDGLAGVTARGIPLALPRAHDCITLFFGSRQAYAADHDAHPGTYYATSGWRERNGFEEGGYAQPAYGVEGVMGQLGLAASRQELIDKYGADNAEFIQQMLGGWQKNYSRALYIEMGICDEGEFIDAARRDAAENSWTFELCRGDLGLMRRLFDGDWDDDFLVVRPGQKIVARNDERILGVEA